MEDTQEQPKNNASHLAAYQFKKGQSGNPGGRPKGKSLRTYAREMIEAMDDDERQTFLNGLDKKVIWEMAEGKPESKVDVTTNGKDLPTPIIPVNVFSNNSHNEDTQSIKED